jgi:hypothetical protein
MSDITVSSGVVNDSSKKVSTGSNRHLVDQLADTRAERKRLDEREASLRRALLVPGADLNGDEHVARVVSTSLHPPRPRPAGRPVRP